MGDETFDVVGTSPAHSVACVYVDEPRDVDERSWQDRSRYHRMVDLRNQLLGHVRDVQPDLYLSVDSDILLHPDTIGQLIETQREKGWDAVGGYCHLKPPPYKCPSYANQPTPHVLRRPDITGQRNVCDVLMAVVLMTPAAYSVDYAHDQLGEDTGWSKAMRRTGRKMGIDARTTNKHVMEQRLLRIVDQRCGY